MQAATFALALDASYRTLDKPFTRPGGMAPHQPRSLKHEYDTYVESEIENYKDSIPRNAILAIGDEAVASLGAQMQFALTEILLMEEVDRIIRKRLRLPTYTTWRRRRVRQIEKFRTPGYWGMRADAPLVRALPVESDARVDVAGTRHEGSALFLAARGCRVTAIEEEADVVERVMHAAIEAGMTGRVQGVVAGLGGWNPDGPITGVVCTAESLAGLSPSERARVIALLQGATRDGGVHLVQTIVAGQHALTLEELRVCYRGWDISVDRTAGVPVSFLARKGAA